VDLYNSFECKRLCSGRFVKQERWERWRAKRKLVSGSQHRRGFALPRTAGSGCGIGPPPPAAGVWGYHPVKKTVEIVREKKPEIWCIFAAMPFIMHVVLIRVRSCALACSLILSRINVKNLKSLKQCLTATRPTSHN